MASTDVALTGDELEAAFNAAVSWVSNPEENAFSVPTPTARQLILYGFYKQATKGDNNTAQPWMVQVTAVRSSVASYSRTITTQRPTSGSSSPSSPSYAAPEVGRVGIAQRALEGGSNDCCVCALHEVVMHQHQVESASLNSL